MQVHGESKAGETNTARAGVEARPHRRDRKQQFEAYEKKKRLLERLGGRIAEVYEHEAQPIETTRERKKLFSEVPVVVGERAVLDRVVSSDADALRDLISNPRVQRYLPTYLFEKQFDDAGEAIRQLYGDIFENEESLILAVRAKETGELAGLAEFYGLRDELHKVSVGYRLRESWWGKGLATEVAILMVGYLYAETDIQIITASTMVENTASAHVLEKADFICTARNVEEDWGFPEPTIVDKWFC